MKVSFLKTRKIWVHLKKKGKIVDILQINDLKYELLAISGQCTD